jgi:hypothetical protein
VFQKLQVDGNDHHCFRARAAREAKARNSKNRGRTFLFSWRSIIRSCRLRNPSILHLGYQLDEPQLENRAMGHDSKLSSRTCITSNHICATPLRDESRMIQQRVGCRFTPSMVGGRSPIGCVWDVLMDVPCLREGRMLRVREYCNHDDEERRTRGSHAVDAP